ncbi:F-actin-capping protein subunit alpha [Ceratocystis fimbriata CBS 114723]|uniref:F-actin-capping protein subunit alpha n=1 Tax=Ceratocystis fimbriata CBS 114723 TaxID=1035309 RepID=A0A2C5X0L4_9PEZI|nr:F-actin-capping protein subunit alpha [Ceratocystis fimbriata CBS 114723]
MYSQLQIVSDFVEGAPPGEALTLETPDVVSKLAPAFQKYNEEQFTSVKLPGGSQSVIISPFNSLGDNSYYDIESSVSFDFDHAQQTASNVKSYMAESSNIDLIADRKYKVAQNHVTNIIDGSNSTIKSLKAYVNEHFPKAFFGAYPAENDSKVAVMIVSSKYSPNNFWSGRWRSHYLFDPVTKTLEGWIKVDVHYYEDGNVRLLTNKTISNASVVSGTGAGLAKEISGVEKKYQEELNRGFTGLSEGAFKGLRRQLPVTRQKIEWDKVTSYRLGQDIGGGTARR